jgi:hypothetical protein
MERMEGFAFALTMRAEKAKPLPGNRKNGKNLPLQNETLVKESDFFWRARRNK